MDIETNTLITHCVHTGIVMMGVNRRCSDPGFEGFGLCDADGNELYDSDSNILTVNG